jgi:phytoene dehydrogenase-like protein
MIDEFFSGFYGGIFLEDTLITSSRLFEFTFSMFSKGGASLPAEGMGALPMQLERRLPPESLHLKTTVSGIEGNRVHSTGGEWTADQIILAVDASTYERFYPSHYHSLWRSTTCLHYRASAPPYPDRLIALRGDRAGLIHHVVVPSNIQPGYAPDGEALVTVTLIDNHEPDPSLASHVGAELVDWFGPEARAWELLRCEQIRHALPVDPPGHQVDLPKKGIARVCGDHTTSASIEGAILSGLRAAEDCLSF